MDRRTDRRTDRQTDRVRRNMRPPPREEGRIIKAAVDFHSSDMFQAENRETINSKYLKSCCVLQAHYDDERDKTVFHNATSDQQDQDQDHSVQDQDRFLVSDRSCPKTDGLRPHHWTKMQSSAK